MTVVSGSATLRPAAIIWRAARDGVAHGHRRGDTRTGCGARILDERLAWPRTSWCAPCVGAFAPASEGEQREAFGR